MRELTFEPRPLSEIQGKQDEAGLSEAWHRRGVLLAETSLAEWPFMDWEVALRAAAAFTIAAALKDTP